MKLRRSVMLLAPLLMVLGSAPTHGQNSGSVQGLGFLGVGGTNTSSAAWNINSDGSVVVGESEVAPGRNLEAFRWTQEKGIVGLGYLGDGGPYPVGQALGVNLDGSVVVGVTTYSNALFRQAVLWMPTTGIVGLGFLGGDGFHDSFALGVNWNGSVVVGSSTYSTSSFWNYQAFRWTQTTGMLGLGFLSGERAAPYSGATGVTADGSVIVGESEYAANQSVEAFRWSQESGMVGLGFLGGGEPFPFSRAAAVNLDGSVVVGASSNRSNQEEAFRWTQSTGMVGLGFVSEGGVNQKSAATGVSADGSVVVGVSSTGSTSSEAFRWSQATGTQSLASLLTAAGVVLGGRQLLNAKAISANGQFIVGESIDAYGQHEAYVVRYIDRTVRPLPSPQLLPKNAISPPFGQTKSNPNLDP
jgi:probable HAF family extracellular repeat protein